MTISATVVDRLHEDFASLLHFLDRAGEPSLRNVADDNFRKTLLLAAASYFEHRLTKGVVDFAEETTSKDHVIRWLVQKKAVDRQYHTWFDWNARNANQLFRLFGEAFGRHMKTAIEANSDLASSIQAFLEIGRERNRLVHQDFGTFTLEKTSQEIYDMYRLAAEFVEWFPEELREFASSQRGNAAHGSDQATT